EAGIIRNMLESIYKHIDYYVIQDNGSTDGTPDIIKQFFAEKNIPGIIYFEPWVNFGYNRNHTLQKCLEAPHNCEYIIRVDADEVLEVADDFDWSMLRTKDAWNVYCNYNGWSVHRMWIWSTKLPWEFTEFSRHETIQLKTEASWSTGTLPSTFKHVLKGGGATWTNPYKFAIDGLELEKDQLNFFLKKNKLDSYHYYYIGRSYAYHFGDGSVEIKYPFEGYKEEIGRRCIWFYDCWMDKFYPNHRDDGFTCPDWWVSSAYTTAALIHLHLNETDLFLKKSLKAYALSPERNDSMYRVIEYYFKRGEYLLAMNYCKFILKNKYNNQNDTDPTWYSDSGWKLPEIYIKSALATNHIQEAIEGARLIKFSSYYDVVPSELKEIANKYS
ncbi:MAG: glycosyltransferase, partial [Alphaproteobacteria bacterium]|nr:glycosyltransferase [Alphaproteobacteria bacterium]